MTQENNLKPGEWFYNSKGECVINLGFVPDRIQIDAEGNYIAEDSLGNEQCGVVPYDPGKRLKS